LGTIIKQATSPIIKGIALYWAKFLNVQSQIHSVKRAKKAGSINDIIPQKKLHPYLIKAIEEGMSEYIDFEMNA